MDFVEIIFFDNQTDYCRQQHKPPPLPLFITIAAPLFVIYRKKAFYDWTFVVIIIIGTNDSRVSPLVFVYSCSLITSRHNFIISTSKNTCRGQSSRLIFGLFHLNHNRTNNLILNYTMRPKELKKATRNIIYAVM